MPPFKCLHWTRHLHVFCVYGILLLPQFWTVWGACTNGYEISCIWTHDEKTTLRWVSATESGENFVRLTGCPTSECGTAVMRSPWLEPRAEDSVVVLHYKLYGTSNVYLRLYLKPDDGTSQLTLFSKEGNYKFPFPNEWTTKKVTIPAIPKRHRLLLKAQIPYPEAYVSVKGLNLDGNIPIESTIAPTTTEVPEEGGITTTLYTTEEEEILPDPTDFPDYEEETEEDEIGMYQEEDSFREVEELKKGYTRIMDPNICKYRKPKRMKWK